MKFVKKNILKTNRNGVLVANSSTSTSTIKAGGSSFNGNYLPATSNGDGTYTVNLDKVTFNGTINATGEISAFGKGTSAEGGSTGNVTIYDGLDSSDPNVALSANQGRILKGLIDTKSDSGGGTSADLSNYYDKATTDSLFQPKGNYLTSIPSEYITETELTNKGYITSSSLNGYAKTSAIPTKVSQLTNDKNYLTSHQSLAHLAKKDGSDVSGTWDNLSIGGSAKRLAAFKHNEGDYLTFINGTRTDNTQNRALVDDGWRLKFTGTRPYYESSPLATINDEVAKSKEAIKINAVDNRSIGDKPRAKKLGVYADLKQNPTNGLKDGGSFNCALTIRGYGEADDFTGGYPHQLAFTDNGNIWTRRAENSDSWKSWNKIWHSGIFNPDTKVNKQGSFTIYTDDQKPYNYIHLFRIANKGTWSNLRVDIDFKSRYNAAKLYIDISTNDKTYGEGNSYLRISQLCANDRTAEFYVKQTVITPKPDEPTKGLYNYYDVYYKSGSWNSGSYGITNQGKNGDLVFEVFNKKLESLPNGTSIVLEKLSINGNIKATGEITAYATNAKTLEETPTTMALADEDVRVYDGLDSTDSKVALSANQGYILMNTIQNLQTRIDELQKQLNDLTGQ